MVSWEARKSDRIADALTFQTLDWYCDDIKNENENEQYTIFVFGVNQENIPITLSITDFYPFFFIEIPIQWNSSCIYSVKESLKFRGKSIEYLERKRYHGFENNKIRHFLKLSFYSARSMRYLRYQIANNSFLISGKEHRFDLYESNIDPILRFTHLRDILTAGWIKVTKFEYSDELLCYTTNWKNIQHFENGPRIADIRVMYFDIEACSEDGSFPNALNKNDPVTQICCIYKDTVTKNTRKVLFNLGTIDSIEDTLVMQFPSEKKMLLSYATFIRDIDPDIIVGYNIFGFDNGYLFERAKVLGIEEQFNFQSKLPFKRTDIEYKVLNNQQSGFNDWKMTKMYGRIHIDLLQVIKKDFKLESYKLDYVGEYFLKQGKDDITPKEIFEAWNTAHGTREKRTLVGKYCVQDTNLCLLLFEKFAVLPNHIEMAKVTRVPLEYLITRGQSIKVFSQIAYETRKTGYLIPVLPKTESDSKFQGATVLEAHIGHYTRPVCGLDFASLYPSIMIAHNMCYSTVVLDQKYNNLPGFEYSTIECGETNGTPLSFTFVQNQPGVLSGILQSLWKNRKVTKKEMNATTDPFVKTVLNAKQLAIKVSMNSIYGFTGATVGALPCLEISQSVTGCGRLMIEQTQKHAKEMFQCEIVYGDSVTGDTPVLTKMDGIHSVRTIQDLFELYPHSEYPQFKAGSEGLSEKEQSIPDTDTPPLSALHVWSASGWSKVNRIIRHRCNKGIYRISTPTGIVDVTEDHSLLSEQLIQIKPGDLHIDQRLFHRYPEQLFIALTNKEMHLVRYLNNSKEIIMKLMVQTKLEASRYYMIGRHLKYGVVLEIIEGLYQVCYYKNTTFNDYHHITEITFLGKIDDYVYDIETVDGTFQAGIGQMIVKNTDSCYVIFPEPVDKDGTLTTLFGVAERAAKKISETFKKPIELEFEKFMYPLILVAKKRYMYLEWTDPKKHNGEIEAKGVELVRRDNCPYVKETLDRVLTPIMFENNVQKGKSEAEHCIDDLLNGLVPIKKLILSKTLRNEYKGYHKVYLKKLEDGRPDTSGPYHWIHTKEDRETGEIKKIQEHPTMAHVALVEKMRERDPNSAPKPGDRVPFVYTDIGNPKELSWKKTEDPGYVLEHNIPIDTLYYLEHQLKNPLKTIFDILLGETKCEQMFQRPSLLKAKQREKLSIGEAKRKKENNKDIRSFFRLKV
jgi:DNA polymerase elongation subunit (family B)